jgi:general secretion pathway protein D
VGPLARGGEAAINPTSLAQVQSGGGPAMGSTPSIPFGPPSAGGSTQNFQPLIDLIQSTVAADSWDVVGGQGAIRPFETNLSLVVRQTQEVHEEIADLLEQLRRLQDLQVTIEVRFITLNDTFFERIGVDFDFNIQTGVNEPLNMTAVPTSSNGSASPESLGLVATQGGRSQTIGLDNTGNPGVALSPNRTGLGQTGQNNQLGRNFFSVPFRQNSFGAAQVPALPGLPDPATSAANFGFAILSDIEAYFLIQAAQGNTRSNVMQAPKVTLFNGQQAFVSDTTQRPFVTSVIPVVGDFSAAQQPVITVLNEGTAVNVQAVVSNDRRFVRLTLVPFFSQIGQVQEFQFEGSRSTKAKSSDEKSGTELDLPGLDGLAGVSNGGAAANEFETLTNGTTIQLPEFIFTTVTTTVSVPDGGTVLLGGIKRLNEARNEFGVPILSKVPYINRLFKNVGLGRTTRSIMLMVTPRIIIQEEEEERLLGANRQ